MKARIVIGANYGDEGKGTVVATYTKYSKNVLNILTNGGAQRGHSILTPDGSITFQHFGSGTYYGADNYYSRFFILNPMQFVKEYESLIIKPVHIYRHPECRWSTPFDMIANTIMQEKQKLQGSCRMGIWNTIKRYKDTGLNLSFDRFMDRDDVNKYMYLGLIKNYYDGMLGEIPDNWKDIWNDPMLIAHFINDCKYLYNITDCINLEDLSYSELIFENGQGLLLSDRGSDDVDCTPTLTGSQYALIMAEELGCKDITLHYVTRPYLTRHGVGYLNTCNRDAISSSVQEDRTNHYNEGQGNFRFGKLDPFNLIDRINRDRKNHNFIIELTHCDEMDRVNTFQNLFGKDKVNTYDSPLIK